MAGLISMSTTQRLLRLRGDVSFRGCFQFSSCPITGSTEPSPQVELKIVPTIPFLGSVIPQYSNTPLLDLNKFYEYYPEMRRRHGDFYKVGVPGLGKGRDGIFYVVTDPIEMQKVIRQERGKSPPYPRGVIESEWPLLDYLHKKGSILGNGTDATEDEFGFAGRGETWKRLRTFLQTDLLSPQAANGYISIMTEAADLASKGAPASSDDLNAYVNRCSFDLFNSLMFGHLTKLADPQTGNDEENLLFCKSAVDGMDNLFGQMTNPLLTFLFKFGIRTNTYTKMKSSLDTALEIAELKYHAFRAKSEANKLTDAEKSSYLARAIIRQKEESGNIAEEELAELIKVALFAAIDTTSSLLSWNMLHLALNYEVQEKLHAELVQSIGKCGGLKAEALRKVNVPYLHAVLRETHRLTPANPITLMKENSTSAVEIHGTIIPKDSLVVMDGHSVGLDPGFVDDPQEFRPERWLPENVEARKGTPSEILDHPYYRDSFSQGSRKCPGSRVANNEVLIMISQLVLDWKMSPPDGYGKEDVTYFMQGMVHPHIPKLKFVARVV
jgi:cytochrome P450